MKQHKGVTRTGKRFGVPFTLTSTLCGRSNSQSSDGMNIADDAGDFLIRREPT